MQQSRAIQYWSNTLRQVLLNTVTLLSARIVTFVPQHWSKAVGGSYVHAVPHSTILFGEQVMDGGLVSVMVISSVQNAEFVQQSVAFQVSVMI